MNVTVIRRLPVNVCQADWLKALKNCENRVRDDLFEKGVLGENPVVSDIELSPPKN